MLLRLYADRMGVGIMVRCFTRKPRERRMSRTPSNDSAQTAGATNEAI
ncbi:MAG: hypothetical protein JW913_16715 [Chitinispirillaceae bacterium]|nr:hypothetical protein [Chitinispirillaceae bacterium]